MPIKGEEGVFVLICLTKGRSALFAPGQLSLLVATKPAMCFNLNSAFVRPHNIVKLNNGEALRLDGFKSHQHTTLRRIAHSNRFTTTRYRGMSSQALVDSEGWFLLRGSVLQTGVDDAWN